MFVPCSDNSDCRHWAKFGFEPSMVDQGSGLCTLCLYAVLISWLERTPANDDDEAGVSLSETAQAILMHGGTGLVGSWIDSQSLKKAVQR